MLKKIDELKEPPIVGKYYLVPCIYKPKEVIKGAGDVKYYEDNNGGYYIQSTDKIIDEKFIPILNHPHEDKQTGQPEYHYHIDSRFISHSLNINSLIRINKVKDEDIRYIELRCYEQHVSYRTDLYINKKYLKHKCIYKGRCPHRGYPMHQEIPVNNILTCPLHSLQFDATTKKLLNNE